MDYDEDGIEKPDSTRNRAKTRSYDVGYGKPPKATRFGVRPQPLRRSPANGAHPNRQPDLASFLDQPIEVKLNGRATKLHPLEATLHGLFARIVKGQLRPIKQFLRECERAGLLEPEILQRSAVIHSPKNVPTELAGYILLRQGPPPWSEEIIRPYMAEYQRDLAQLKALKERALRLAREGGEDVY